MSCYPADSRALGVLLGFQREIRAFVELSDQCNLSRVSWWLYHSAGRSQNTGHASWPTDAELHAQTQRLHARLARGGDVRIRRTRVRLSAGQVRVLLRDLLLVASGLRPSCLVDCCALTTELAELLLDCLTDKKESCHQWFVSSRVRAVQLDGNVFFVNVDAFMREKMAELATDMYVDVSASLPVPRLISSNSEAGTSRLKAFAEWTVTVCRHLLTSTSSRVRVLEWTRPSSLNATALAGMLLCYPCVYDILVDGDVAGDDEWCEQENCLTMCPLYLLQTTALVYMPQEQMELALQEFSVPQHLLHNGIRFNKKNHEQEAEIDHAIVNPLLLNLLRARCRLKLQRAIERSRFGSSSRILPQVRVGSRTLHRVAL